MIYKIDLIKNEGFYGGAINDGISMPYKDGNFSRDLREWHGGNQASSILVSNKGRYVYSNYPFNIKLENNCIIIESEHEVVISKNGSNLKSGYEGLARDFYKNDHKTPNLLMFEKPQYNTWIEMEWDCTETKVLKYAHEIISNGYPTGVLMIDDCWCKDYGVWDFDVEKFPNAKRMVDELHKLGFKVMLWICPFVSPDSKEFRELESKGLLVKKDDQSAISHWWNGYSGVLDLSKPEARDYFNNIADNLMNKYGVDGFKMDAGDPEYYHEGFKFADGKEKSFQAQYWAEMGERYEFNELRVAFNNNLKCVAHRLRDKNHSRDNEGLNMLIPNALAMGICGYPYLCPDMIGGGMVPDFHREGFKFDEELFVRYAQVAALFPMMQFSRSPWKVLSVKNQDYCLNAVNLHLKYSDLIKSLAINASKTGEPILRYLSYNYSDVEYLDVNDQFLLGDDIMVAPQLKKGNNRKVVVPNGVWVDEQGKKYEKGIYEIEVPLSRLPIFKRIG